MDNARLYYTAPPDEQFEELKEKALQLWSTYDDTYGYASEKKDRVERIGNIKDNFMYIVAMFDMNNQRKLSWMLSEETKKSIRERMIDGGSPSRYIVF